MLKSRNHSMCIFSLLNLLAFSLLACEKDSGPAENPTPSNISIRIDGAAIRESDADQEVELLIKLSTTSEQDIKINYITVDQSAMRGLDYRHAAGDIRIPAGQMSIPLKITIMGDDQYEALESFLVRLSDPEDIATTLAQAVVQISNDDERQALESDGYHGAQAYEGYNMLWSDEFDASELEPVSWTIAEGNGCPDLCGWGNNELQHYTNKVDNLSLEDGKLIITAKEEDNGGMRYSSARIHTKDKIEVTFGRIDIRARMPEGKGVWPAIWMLGANIDQVNWPASGEIDILELVGHEPSTAHGTVHFGANFESRKSITKATALSNGKFSDNFHLFSILWQPNAIRWYVDDILFHEVSSKDTAGANYPFNLPFYFLFNVAVGGNWPGDPDQMTVFPQQMVVDYIRVFQLEE